MEMGSIKINGTIAKQEEVEQLRQLYSGNSADAIFGDNAVTNAEIRQILDIDHNGKYEIPDLARLQQRVGWNRFASAKDMLKKHGFNVYQETQDNLRSFSDEALRDSAKYKDSYQQNYGQILTDPDLLLTVIKKDEYSIDILKEAPDEIKNNKELFSQVVTIAGVALQYASTALQSDPSIVLQAVKQAGSALRYVSDSLKSNKRIVGHAVNNLPYALKWASPELRDDKALVTLAIEKDGLVLQFASERLRNDRDVVMAAVKEAGPALQYASPSLQDDPEVVTMSLVHYGDLADASERLKSDHDFVLNNAVLGRQFKYLSAELRADRSIALKAISENGSNLQYVSDTLRDDKEIVLAAVSEHLPSEPEVDRGYGASLEWASERLRSDREVVTAAIQSDAKAFEFASEELRSDPEIVRLAVEAWPFAIEFAGKAFKKDKKFLLDAITKKPETDRRLASALRYVDPSLLEDKEFMLAMVKIDGFCLHRAAGSLRRDKDVVLAAVTEDNSALRDADSEIQSDFGFITTVMQKIPHGYAQFCVDEKLRRPLDYASRKISDTETHRINIDDHPNLLTDLVMEDFNLIRFLSDEDAKRLWPEIQKAAEHRGIKFQGEDFSSRDNFLEKVQSFTEFPERFHSLRDFSDVLYRQLPAPNDPRPVALLLYPKTDWNGAFAGFPLTDRFIDSNKFQVIYKEVDSQQDLQSEISAVASVKKIHTLVVSGHGTDHSMQLGDIKGIDTSDGVSDEELREYDNRMITPYEFSNHTIATEHTIGGESILVPRTVPSGAFDKLETQLDPNGQILLYSCSNGSGGEQGENLTNAFAKVVPHGVEIISTLVPSNIWDVKIQNDLSLEVQWNDNHSYQRNGELEPNIK